MHSRSSPTRFRARFALLASMVTGAALLRVVPHPENFTPVGGLALFAGARFGSLAAAFAVPLAAMAASDLLLELLGRHGIHSGMAVVYACFAGAVLLGRFGARDRAGRVKPARLAAATLAAALLFFLATNFAVWARSSLYSRDASGLLACFVAALPFFRNSLAGDFVAVAGLFGAFALAERRWPALRRDIPSDART